MSAGDRVSIVLADDHAVFRDGLRALLQINGDLQVVGEASTGREAVALARELNPAVVVMDISMPLLNGLQATRQMRINTPQTRVLILSAYRDDTVVNRAIECGAAGYLLKRSCTSVLTRAIREVVKGTVFYDPALSGRPGMKTRTPADGAARTMPRLTDRQEEVLQSIAEGAPNKQIAADLGISIKTVEKHRHQLMEKLNIHSTAGLTRYAIEAGIIDGGFVAGDAGV